MSISEFFYRASVLLLLTLISALVSQPGHLPPYTALSAWVISMIGWAGLFVWSRR